MNIQPEHIKRLAGEYAHCYAFVGDDTMPRKQKELHAAIDALSAERDALAAMVEKLREALNMTKAELCACQSVIHYHGGFDPKYSLDARAALKVANAALAAEILRGRDAEIIERCAKAIEGGNFLHDQAPAKLFAADVCRMLRHMAAEIEAGK